MTLPTHDQCRRVIEALRDEPALTEWEHSFVTSNEHRTTFTDAQREAVVRLMEKYEID